jgi:hypothetical protein
MHGQQNIKKYSLTWHTTTIQNSKNENQNHDFSKDKICKDRHSDIKQSQQLDYYTI